MSESLQYHLQMKNNLVLAFLEQSADQRSLISTAMSKARASVVNETHAHDGLFQSAKTSYPYYPITQLQSIVNRKLCDNGITPIVISEFVATLESVVSERGGYSSTTYGYESHLLMMLLHSSGAFAVYACSGVGVNQDRGKAYQTATTSAWKSYLRHGGGVSSHEGDDPEAHDDNQSPNAKNPVRDQDEDRNHGVRDTLSLKKELASVATEYGVTREGLSHFFAKVGNDMNNLLSVDPHVVLAYTAVHNNQVQGEDIAIMRNVAYKRVSDLLKTNPSIYPVANGVWTEYTKETGASCLDESNVAMFIQKLAQKKISNN